MSDQLVTRGIVLRETKTKDADKILTVLSAAYGRIAVVARGVRRKNSTLAAASELLAYSELVLSEQHRWLVLNEASTLELWRRIRQDVVLLSLASYFAELCEAVTDEGMDASEQLSLLLNALYALDRLEKPPELVRAAFEWKLLAVSGYEPLTDGCAVCGTPEPQEPCFSPQEGVLLCRRCAGVQTAGLLPLDSGALAAMRHVLRSNRKRMLSFRLGDDSLRYFSRASETFARVQLERSFRTLEFYQNIRG